MDAKNAPALLADMPGFSMESLSVFENVFDFFGTLGSDGRVKSLAGRIFKSTNTNPDLLLGHVFSETVFWQSSETNARLIEKAISNAAAGVSSKLTIGFRVSADEKMAMEVFVQPLEHADGNGEVFISGQSVSERKRQAEQLKGASEQLLFAAENAEIGLWFWDYNENRIHANPSCNELFGLSAYKSFVYDEYREAIYPADRDFVDGFLKTSRLEGTRYEEQFRVVHPDGSIEWLCAEGRSFLDEHGKPNRMTGAVQKITEQKNAADEIAKVHELERKAREEAVEANRSKDFFLAFVSHELRSPLNAILGWAKILLSKDLDEEMRRNALETIERSARFQTKLINDLVDSARVASGKLRLEYRPTDLHDIVFNSVEAQRPTAESKSIDLQFRSTSDNIQLVGDSNRLQQVFGNLISNAIKFTPDGGKILVDISTSADSVKVEITDSGYGIDPVALPQIFKQFSQGDIDQAKTNVGLGLGLSIVKILVTKHGGVVQAESEGVGKGSKFTVTLPFTKGAVISLPEQPAPVQKERPLDGLSIFIVEDDADSREVLELFLGQNGAIVRSFDAVRAAIAAFDEAAILPNVIISDLGMPDEDGYSLIRQVRALPADKGGGIPAIALSAFTSVESREKALELGFDKYSTKPFEHDQLIVDLLAIVDQHGG